MNKVLLFLLVSCLGMIGCGHGEELEVQHQVPDRFPSGQVKVPVEVLLQKMLSQYPNSNYQQIMADAASANFLKGKSLAYLGASLVNLPECDLAQYMVEKAFGCEVTDYGHGGYGYAAKNNLQHYAANMGKHDVYVIWGTTNDYSLDVPVGSPTDYTEEDGFDESKLKTACGGMNYAIQQARRINPEALLIGYTTVKMFNGVRLDGSLRSSTHTNDAGYHFFDYVDAQLACFKRAGIPCLNVWDWNFYTHGNWSDYFMKDGVHMQYSGYFFLAQEHIKFLTKIGKDDNITGIEDIVM